MDLSLSELIRIRILPPADRSPAVSPGKKIHSMVILEGGSAFFEHLPQHALIFFLHGASSGLSPASFWLWGKPNVLLYYMPVILFWRFREASFLCRFSSFQIPALFQK